MGVGTDTMKTPKFGFVKTEGVFKPTSELQIHGILDPGMNAEELNHFPIQKYVQTCSESISCDSKLIVKPSRPIIIPISIFSEKT